MSIHELKVSAVSYLSKGLIVVFGSITFMDWVDIGIRIFSFILAVIAFYFSMRNSMKKSKILDTEQAKADADLHISLEISRKIRENGKDETK